MNILITGAAGFIGSALSKRMSTLGFSVTGLDNMTANMRMPQGLDNYKVCNVEDVLDKHNKLPPHDVIIHLAASFANEKSVDYPTLDCCSNVVGTCAIAALAKQWGARLIYAGSSSSYGAPKWNGDKVRAFSEDSILDPHTPYALSKLMGEQYAKLLCPDALILRLFNVFGAGDPPTVYRNAIPRMVRSAIENSLITVYGANSGRDFMHIDTLVDIIIGFVSKHPYAKGVYNVSTGKPTYMKTVAELIQFHVGGKINIMPRRAWDKVDVRVGDNFKVFDLFKNELLMAPTVGDRLPEIIDYVEGFIKETKRATR